jgi:hypothetical protein
MERSRRTSARRSSLSSTPSASATADLRAIPRAPGDSRPRCGEGARNRRGRHWKGVRPCWLRSS